MKKNILKFALILALVWIVLSPALTFAATSSPSSLPGFPGSTEPNVPGSPMFLGNNTRVCVENAADIGDIICKIGELLKSIVPVLMALGVVYFVFGVVQYVIASDEEAKKSGKDRIIFGIIGFAVIAGLWGLVALVVNTFGVSNNFTFVNPASFVDQVSAGSGSSGFCSLPANSKFPDLLNFATCIISKSVIPLLFVLAIAAFVWGMVNFFLLNSGEEAKREQGRQFMLWGIIALTVMVSIWGLVGILGKTFNIDTTFIPQVKSPGK